MKNIIIVDIDTERSPIVQIGKPDASQLPTNSEEASEVIQKDMACLCEALSTLIHAAEQSGYKSSSESLKDCITHLERGFADPTYDIKVNKIEEIKEDENVDNNEK
jgi:hypothetical protein